MGTSMLLTPQSLQDKLIAVNEILRLHGGRCEILGVDGGVVVIRLAGGCAGCPSSTMTLYHIVEPAFREVPGIGEVHLVSGDAHGPKGPPGEPGNK